MKLRAIANGNIVEIEDQQQAEGLIQAGIFEAVKEEPEQEERSEQEEDAAGGGKAKRTYKRRDMQAEG